MAVRPFPALLWIVIPAFNEESRIPAVLEQLAAIGRPMVVVDDGSADNTYQRVLEASAWLVAHPINLGQGAALQTGIMFALARGATHIVTFDADGQHRAEDVTALVSALTGGEADFALGSRFLGDAPGIPATRRLVLHLGALFTRALSGVSISDPHCGLRAMTRRGAEHLNITLNRMEHASEIIDQIARSGLKYVEVPVSVRYSAATLVKGQRTSAALGLGFRFLLNKITG